MIIVTFCLALSISAWIYRRHLRTLCAARGR